MTSIARPDLFLIAGSSSSIGVQIDQRPRVEFWYMPSVATEGLPGIYLAIQDMAFAVQPYHSLDQTLIMLLVHDLQAYMW